MLTLEKELVEEDIDDELIEKELEEYLLKKGIKNLSEDKRARVKALFEMSHLLTKDEQDALGRAMEDIERRKLTLYDDLRARYQCDN